ncbi:LamG-like jellyroll fold domain-containing protein, partial [Planctomycetota bacterium]
GPVELSPSGIGMHIGTNQNGGNAFFGLMDEVAIWDRALTFEVDANNNLTSGQAFAVRQEGVSAVTGGNPIGYWAFEDSDDLVAVDSSGNDFDAFLDGGAEKVSTAAPGVGGDGAIALDGFGTINVETMERPGGEFAYSFWFNADSAEYGDDLDAASDPRVDFLYGNGEGGTVRPHLSVNRNQRPISIHLNADGDIEPPIEAATDSFSTDEWHHVLFNWDGDIGSVFIDGKLDNQVSLGGGAAAFPITAVDVGGELTDGTLAPSRRVNFPIQDTGFASLTDDGIKLFDAAIDWLLGSTTAVPGDFNNDGSLTVDDVDLLSTNIALGTNDVAFDLNNDSQVDGLDLNIWVKELKFTWFGDADLDGAFTSSDFVTVFGSAKYETGQAATWEQGDWNADGAFNSADFVAAFSDGGYEKGPRTPGVATVPEPNSMMLLGGLLCLAIVRRKKSRLRI